MHGAGTRGTPARRGPVRLLRAPLAVSLILHAALLGAALVWAAQRANEEPPIRIGAIRLRPPVEHLAPAPEELEPLPLEQELPWTEALEPLVLDSAAVDLEHPFEDEATPSQRPPPVSYEVPLHAARRPHPAPPVAPPVAPPLAPPVTRPQPAPRPTVIYVRPAARPTPRPAPRVAPSVRRPAPLRVVSAPDPRRYYPPSALQRRLAGRTLVRLLIDARGRVTSAHVVGSSGHRLLDQAAVALAYAYRFSTGAGVRATRLPVTFRPPVRG